ncbi:MAG: glycogen synthase GlgA [Rhizobiaceae bacterium]|nr:glycogen synthase GlgA [Rhizobiaceae bacterium]
MKVLSVASEVVPLVKTGGLADVAGALPAALAGHGVEMRTLMPGYPAVMKALGKKTRVKAYADLFGGKAAIVRAKAAGLDLYVVDAPHLYDRDGGIYGQADGTDWPDNWARFAALGRAAADLAAGADEKFRPDIVHAHDWQAALAPAYLHHSETAVPTVVTVHNLAFQGRFGAEVFSQLGLPPAALAVDGIEYYGGIGFLKAGLQYAGAITTVSPTYAREIRTPEFGMGLDGLLNARADRLHGILNGIDTDVWDPAGDRHLASRYSARSLKDRKGNRLAVEKRFGLDADDDPIICVVSRLTWQKGMDILAAEFDAIIAAGAKLAILGSGDQALEGALLAAAARHEGRAGVVIGYDEALSHLLQGGSDAILIPSRFEPCGLTQLYGLRYGCVPLVARTGGLADTVIDANDAALSAGVATGLQFAPDRGDAMTDAVRRMVALYRAKAAWKAIQKQGMKADVSWLRSAGQYAALYRALMAGEGRT